MPDVIGAKPRPSLEQALPPIDPVETGPSPVVSEASEAPGPGAAPPIPGVSRYPRVNPLLELTRARIRGVRAGTRSRLLGVRLSRPVGHCPGDCLSRYGSGKSSGSGGSRPAPVAGLEFRPADEMAGRAFRYSGRAVGAGGGGAGAAHRQGVTGAEACAVRGSGDRRIPSPERRSQPSPALPGLGFGRPGLSLRPDPPRQPGCPTGCG